MATRLVMEGLSEFRAQLRQLPEDLTQEAAQIITAHAEQARADVSNGYPMGPTGNLKRRVTVIHNVGRRFFAQALVKSAAPHAWIFENGTASRRTRSGANRGAMPLPPESERMIPKVVRIRRRMVEALIELVRRAGFEVTT